MSQKSVRGPGRKMGLIRKVEEDEVLEARGFGHLQLATAHESITAPRY